MSAWPQAIWIVKKIQKSFNYIYNNIEDDIEALQHKDEDLEDKIKKISPGGEGFNVAVADFVDTKTDEGLPTNSHETTTGTIWFVQQG